MIEDEKVEVEFQKRFPRLHSNISGDGQALRKRLAIAAFFVMAFEAFKDFAEGKYKEFFSDGFDGTTKDVRPILGEAFKKQRQMDAQSYRTFLKDKGHAAPKNVSDFQAGCMWFLSQGALVDEDILLIAETADMRNNFAHELFNWLVDETYPELDEKFVNVPLRLERKVGNWWIRNVEEGILPEQYAQFTDEEMRGATTMAYGIMAMMLKNAFPDATSGIRDEC